MPDITEQVAQYLNFKKTIASATITAVRAADREAGMVLVQASDVKEAVYKLGMLATNWNTKNNYKREAAFLCGRLRAALEEGE